MRHGEHWTTPTVFDVVRRAVAIVDPDGDNDRVDEFLRRHEDRDEPVTAVSDRDRQFFEEAGKLEGQGDDPALTMAAAVATYLAFRRDEVSDDDEDLLRLAARAEFDAHPPPEVAAWLQAQGVGV